MAIGLGFGAFAAGMALLLVVLGSAALAGRRLARRLAPGATGAEAVLAWALCAAAALIAAHAIPLTLGVLSRATVVAASLLLAAAATRIPSAHRRPTTENSHPPRQGEDNARGSWVVVLSSWFSAALVAGAALAYLRVQVAQPVISSDALNFQVPQVVRWMQTGSLWQLDQFFPGYSNATYPQHGNLLILSVVLPFDSAFLVRLVAVPFAGMAALAVVAGARAVGATTAWAVLAAALLAAVPVLAKVTLDGAQTDVPFLAFAGAGGVFLLRHHRSGARGDLVLAALGFGLALGTKWYALTTLPLAGLVWVAARLLAGTGVARVARQAAALAAGALLAGGLWLLRNWVEAANPLFPQPLGPFLAPRDEIREQAGFTLAHYLGDWPVWDRYLLPTFDAFLSAPGYVLLAAGLVVAVAAVARHRGAAFAVAVTAVALVGGYFVTPYGAFGPEGAPVLAFASVRYALPAALAGAIALAWGASRLPRPAGAVLAGLLVVAVALGVREQYRPSVSWVAIGGTAVLVAVLALVVHRASRPAMRRRPAGGLAVAAVVVVLVAGAAVVRDRAQTGYGATDPVLAWIEREAPSGRTVGVTGQWSVAGVSPVLPAFGPRLGNEVAYVGPFVGHLLRRPGREATWAARVRAARYDLIVVGLEGPAPETDWARRAGYAEVVSSGRLALFARGD